MKIYKHILILLVLAVSISCRRTEIPPAVHYTPSRAMQWISTSLYANYRLQNSQMSAQSLQRHLQYDFCLDFRFPLQIHLNNGNEAVLHNHAEFAALIALLSQDIYIDAVVFPLEIIQGSQVLQIQTDDELVNVIENCDHDGDGIPNYADRDDDNDGISDSHEDINQNGDYTDDDFDGDGTPNYNDEDDDNDGINTADEDNDHDGDVEDDDSDGDGSPDYLDTDSDNDGTPDGDDDDADGDGVDDDQED